MKHYTSIEQSKKLLELGLNPKSADMTYCAITEKRQEKMIIKDWQANLGLNIAIKENLFSYRNGFIVPCWSVGALLELIPKHPKFNIVFRFLERQIDDSYKYIWIFECHAVSEYIFEGTSDFDCIYQAIVWLLQNNYIKTE